MPTMSLLALARRALRDQTTALDAGTVDDTARLTQRPYIPMLDESDNVREGFVEPAEFAGL
jgi:hypothetical protein